jgi:hypothetical protein
VPAAVAGQFGPIVAGSMVSVVLGGLEGAQDGLLPPTARRGRTAVPFPCLELLLEADH